MRVFNTDKMRVRVPRESSVSRETSVVWVCVYVCAWLCVCVCASATTNVSERSFEVEVLIVPSISQQHV